jgi:hypothetical protein
MKGVLLAGALVLAVAAWSQEPLRFAGSLFAGVSASQIHGDGVSGFDKFGWTGGPLLEISRGPVAWEWGLLYTQKGSRKVPNPKTGDYSTWKYRFTYVDVPLIRVWKPESWWWFGVGVQPSLLLRAEEDFFSTGYSPLTTPELKRFDLGAVALVGMEYTEVITFELRMSQSALPIADRPDSPVMRWDNFLMNMALQLGLKLQFNSN